MIDDNINKHEIIESIGKTAIKAVVNDKGETDGAVKKKHFQNYSDILEMLLEDNDHSGLDIIASNKEDDLDDVTNKQKDSDEIEILLEDTDHTRQAIIASNKEDDVDNVINNMDINKDSENIVRVDKRRNTDSRIDIRCKKAST